MLLLHIQLDVHQDPQVIFCRAACQFVCPQPVSLQGVLPSQVQDFVFVLAEFHEVHAGVFIRIQKQWDKNNANDVTSLPFSDNSGTLSASPIFSFCPLSFLQVTMET